MRIKLVFKLITTTFFVLIFGLTITCAEQDTTLTFSPLITIDSTQTLSGEKLLLMQTTSKNAPTHLETSHLDLPNNLRMADLDTYSLALGATVHINDNINIGAACGMPLMNEEPIQVEDLSIEAMVTMQF